MFNHVECRIDKSHIISDFNSLTTLLFVKQLIQAYIKNKQIFCEENPLAIAIGNGIAFHWTTKASLQWSLAKGANGD